MSAACHLCEGPTSRAFLDRADVQRCGLCGYGLRDIEEPEPDFLAARYVGPERVDAARAARIDRMRQVANG